MPTITTAQQALELRDVMKTQHTRVRDLHAITYRTQDLSTVRQIIATDYQKGWVPHLDPAVLKAKYSLTNTLSANQFELQVQALTTDPSKVRGAQKLEDALVALLKELFPHAVRERMYSIMDEPYGVLVLDVLGRKALAQYADRPALEAGAEDDYGDDDYSPKATYGRAYRQTSGSQRERHEQAYKKVTDDALLAEIPFAVRMANLLTFDGPPPSPTDPNRFVIGMEYGRKPLNPLFAIFPDLRLDKQTGKLFLQGADKRKRAKSRSYEGTLGNLVPENEGVTETPGQEYVEFTQIRTCDEIITVIEHPGGKGTKQDPGVLLRAPNMYGGASTGYYLIEGNVRSLPGSLLEDCYDPFLYPLQVLTQLVNVYSSAEGAMALSDALRAPYARLDPQVAKLGGEGMDSTEETKSAQPQDGERTAPVFAGELRRAEALGANLREYATALVERLKEMMPTAFPEGSGGSSESFAHLAAVLQTVAQEQTPVQIKLAEAVKFVAEDILRCVAESGEPLRIPYVVEDGKADIREITPEMARLPVKISVSLEASSPQADAAWEALSERRLAGQIIGQTEHMENIGIDDPETTNRKRIKDRIDRGVEEIVVKMATEAVADVAGQRFSQRWGTQQQQQPLVGPDGMPIQSQQTNGAGVVRPTVPNPSPPPTMGATGPEVAV